METVDQIYKKVKEKSDMPVARLTYITLAESEYRFHDVCVNFNADDESIAAMTKIAEAEDFYAFADSEKGFAFVEENRAEIAMALTNMILSNK
jgi:hypothetical protein